MRGLCGGDPRSYLREPRSGEAIHAGEICPAWRPAFGQGAPWPAMVRVIGQSRSEAETASREAARRAGAARQLSRGHSSRGNEPECRCTAKLPEDSPDDGPNQSDEPTRPPAHGAEPERGSQT